MKKMRLALILVSVFCMLYINAQIQQKKSIARPNVITIIIDDAGWKDVGYLGGTIATPEIDKLAAGSVRLNKFYAYSTCTPTRAALLTGRAPSRSGIVNPIQDEDHFGIPNEVETLAEVFQKNGYKTALIGKWHLGVQKELQPNAHGFDYQYGMLGGWADQYTHVNPTGGFDWNENGVSSKPEKGHSTDIITNHAIDYIKKSKVADPFFLYLSYTSPHVPIQVDPKWAKPYLGKYDTSTRVGYAGMMAQLDYSIGEIIKTLEKRKLLENTLIVFLSDNGPSAPGKKWYVPAGKFTINSYGDDGVYGDVGPLRGWKASPYEGGIRVPAFIYYKGQLKSTDWDTPVIVQDLYPTILGLAKIPSPKNYKVEARNIFSDTSITQFYWRTPIDLALRYGDWKLILHNKSPFETDLKPELYNIETDISESNDLSKIKTEKLNELLDVLKDEFNHDAKININEALLKKELENKK